MRYVGLLILFVCPTIFGYILAKNERKRTENLHEILNLVYHIKNKIEHFNSPLNEIYDSFDCGDVIRVFVNDTKNNGWATSLEDAKHLFDIDVYNILAQFFEGLGKTNQDAQIKHCEFYKNLLEEKYKISSEKTKSQSKLKITLGIYAGILLVILFL